MKKLLALSVATLLSTSAFAAPEVVHLNVAGKVVAHTCTVVGNKFTGTGVVLDDAKITNNGGVKGVESKPKPVSIKFENCDTKTPVYISFDKADTYVTANGYVKNTEADTRKANNVHIKLSSAGQTGNDYFNIKTGQVNSILPTDAGLAEFKFTADYAVEGGEPTTGSVKGRVPVTLQYQ